MLESNQQGDKDAVFRKAQNDFLNSLAPEESAVFSPCSSSAELLDGISKLATVTKHKQRGLKFLRQINRLSDSLQPYFKALDILVSAKPDVAAIAWGSFRLILQVNNGPPGRTQSGSLFANMSYSLPATIPLSSRNWPR